MCVGFHRKKNSDVGKASRKRVEKCQYFPRILSLSLPDLLFYGSKERKRGRNIYKDNFHFFFASSSLQKKKIAKISCE
jgi:hypothetical protein